MLPEVRCTGSQLVEKDDDSNVDPVATGHNAGTVPARAETETAVTKGMVWIPQGEFLMGSEDFYPEERPVHRVVVDGFWIDEHPVTVAQFRRFVKTTGHVTWPRKHPTRPTIRMRYPS